ncbi:Ribosomal RNA small subunit methyltransferase E [Maioricimonas rarisocia]|uniref:Ribosomal RNA small subunit methyltransferase E n=1 Tax=Maioricimonas rarisocia TaxID=2528026 RepID=A0A517ZE81_9PLAN|nr:16S rRNA (uracil(1498)-N(3))-methyltransferase [Maioricimonas rarisocia]QDU40788.1 Ribosomal RNA small subunit methyltransferase E [Maioricimonas rarisocia]
MDRFYAPIASENDEITLPEGEARHFLRVLRGKIGDRLTLFDGRGREMTAEVTTAGKKEVVARILESRREPEPTRRIVLATAVPKGERLRWLIEKATELGIDSVQPLLTERSVVDPRPSKMAKLENNVIAACKQCGRNHLMTLHDPQSLEQLLTNATAGEDRLFAAVPGGPPAVDALASAYDLDETRTILLLVGPEGGWTDAELARIEAAGAHSIGLGRNILRIETAALSLAAIATSFRDREPR